MPHVQEPRVVTPEPTVLLTGETNLGHVWIVFQYENSVPLTAVFLHDGWNLRNGLRCNEVTQKALTRAYCNNGS